MHPVIHGAAHLHGASPMHCRAQVQYGHKGVHKSAGEAMVMELAGAAKGVDEALAAASINVFQVHPHADVCCIFATRLACACPVMSPCRQLGIVRVMAGAPTATQAPRPPGQPIRCVLIVLAQDKAVPRTLMMSVCCGRCGWRLLGDE